MSTASPRIFRAVLVSSERLTPGLLRLTFGGPDLRDFVSTGVGDEYLRFLLPDPANAHVSSSLVRQVAALGGDVSPYVPLVVADYLQGAVTA